jgi:hypothetical protein
MQSVHQKILSTTAVLTMPLQALNADEPHSLTRAAAPPAECEAYVAYDRDRVMPGYLLPTSAGPRTCIPFSTVGAQPPGNYRGDFYVAEFSDARLREKWAACKRDEACSARVFRQINARKPPNKEHGAVDPQHIYLLGKVRGESDVDLRTIRRPAFFGAAPYHEPIAALDSSTYVIEFTAPRDPHEEIHRQMTGSVKLRGWYVRGAGVDDGEGNVRRALIVMTGGGGTRIAAISHPKDQLYRIEADGKTRINSFPSATTGASGQQLWRTLASILVGAGFDVLLHDRRGVGVSSGYVDTNTLQQGRDLLAMVAALRTGAGVRVLTPEGKEHHGRAAVDAVHGGHDARVPVLLLGNSRGTMASGWAMTMNFDKDCSYDLPQVACRAPVRDPSITGAILLAEFTSGPGYVMRNPSEEDEVRGLGKDRPLFIGAAAVEHNIVFFPSSAILAGMDKWPAAFFARGLWDYAAALEGTMDSYNRVRGPKELVVIRAPHPYETWPAAERERVHERILAFACAVGQQKQRVEGGRPWTNMKELVATTSDVWEASTKPSVQ